MSLNCVLSDTYYIQLNPKAHISITITIISFILTSVNRHNFLFFMQNFNIILKISHISN